MFVWSLRKQIHTGCGLGKDGDDPTGWILFELEDKFVDHPHIKLPHLAEGHVCVPLQLLHMDFLAFGLHADWDVLVGVLVVRTEGLLQFLVVLSDCCSTDKLGGLAC